MIDSWLQSGMHSKAIATSFGDHASMSAISFFIGTVCSGGQFVLAGATKPSLEGLQNLGVSHALLADELQAVFNWAAPSRKAQELTLYVNTTTPAFTAEATKSTVKVRAVYAGPLHCGGISGIATPLVVQKE